MTSRSPPAPPRADGRGWCPCLKVVSALAAAGATLAAALTRRPNILSFDKVREMRQAAWTCTSERARQELGTRSLRAGGRDGRRGGLVQSARDGVEPTASRPRSPFDYVASGDVTRRRTAAGRGRVGRGRPLALHAPRQSHLWCCPSRPTPRGSRPPPTTAPRWCARRTRWSAILPSRAPPSSSPTSSRAQRWAGEVSSSARAPGRRAGRGRSSRWRWWRSTVPRASSTRSPTCVAGPSPGFTVAWNALVGVPLLLPSLLYVGVHGIHHAKHHYGTARDPEYLPLGTWPAWKLTAWVLHALLLPVALGLRFLVLSPLSLLHPRLRAWVWGKASALTINPDFTRGLPSPSERTGFLVLEAAAFTWAGALVALLASGMLRPRYAIVAAGAAATVGVLNQLRTVVAHRFRNDGRTLTVEEQFLDSVNVPGREPPPGDLGPRWPALSRAAPPPARLAVPRARPRPPLAHGRAPGGRALPAGERAWPGGGAGRAPGRRRRSTSWCVHPADAVLQALRQRLQDLGARTRRQDGAVALTPAMGRD